MILEICVDCVESAQAAAEGGADRLELCGDLLVGGVTPSPFLIELVQKLGLAVNVLLRPRFGDFCYTSWEGEILLREAEQCRALGVNGVVIGALERDGRLNRGLLSELIAAAGPLHKTLHRAFDLCRDPWEGLEDAAELGFDTILTSGQAATAPEGAALLEELGRRAQGRLTVMAGSGVKSANLSRLAQRTGLRAFHMSARRSWDSPMTFRRPGVPMGLPLAGEYERFYTDTQEVKKARQVLDSLDHAQNSRQM